ncbi:MAG: acyl-CoA dehydrogenase family protein [Myxococcales bacterium]|nr:acyl-CoA dehydrogenase family protein [Myxococcales bacterium]MCB9731469.1 acyl-CoA dehydrogenase family protein [Deltaproteobacteria bacterium]
MSTQTARYRSYPQFGPEHEMLRKTVRDWCLSELAPHADAWEEARYFPDEVFKKAGELGLLGIRVPEEWGGQGLDWWFTTAYAEELVNSGLAGLTMGLLVQSDMATPVIGEIGNDYHKENFWKPAVTGQAIAALGISEPDVGSDVANLRTTAKKVGDDYVINGAKTYITNGTRADFITLAVRTGGDGYKGISLLMFPTDTKGFSVGKKLEKLGNHCSDTAELVFEDCKVPAKNLLGYENAGFYYVMQNFQGERLVGAISAVAGAQRVLDRTVEYCRDRNAFGRPLVGFQTVRHMIVQLEAELEAARQLNYRAVDLVNRKQNAVREITMAKLIGGETACRVADRCLQLYGGAGYMHEYEISRVWRDTRLITIGGGTSEIMREILSKVQGLGK